MILFNGYSFRQDFRCDPKNGGPKNIQYICRLDMSKMLHNAMGRGAGVKFPGKQF